MADILIDEIDLCLDEEPEQMSGFIPTLYDIHRSFNVIKTDRYHGLKGEHETRMTVFTNYVLGKKCVLLRGSRASGKSNAIDIVTAYCPQVELIDKSSDKADYRDSLNINKATHLIIPEINKASDNFIECLPKGTNIITRDGIKDITNVVVGDDCLSDDGNYYKVTKTLKRKCRKNEYMFTIRVNYNNILLNATGNHPLLVYKRKLLGKNKNGKFKSLTSIKDKNNIIPMWVKAKEIEKGDYFVIPRNKQKEVPFNNDIALLLGYFVAEGCFDYQIRKKQGNLKVPVSVIFSFHKKEKEYVLDIIRIMKNIDKEVKINIINNMKDNPNTIMIRTCNKKVVSLISKYVSGSAKYRTKKLSGDFINIKKELICSFLSGFYRGDGTYGKRGIYFTTTSYHLAQQIRLLLVKLGMLPGITKFKISDAVIRGKKLIGKDAYMCGIYSHQNIKELTKIIGWKYKNDLNNNSKNHYFVNNDFIFFTTRNIEKKEYKEKVYNLEVEHRNNFLTEHCIVHNCMKDLGEGKASTYKTLDEYKQTKKFVIQPKPFISSVADENKTVLGEELMSRMTILDMDGSIKQNVNVIEEKLKRAQNPNYKVKLEDIELEKLFDYVKNLPAIDKFHFIYLPGEKIKNVIPTLFTDSRRDIMKYLDNTFGITLFFYHDRIVVNKGKKKKYMLVTPMDIWYNHIIYGNVMLKSSLKCNDIEQKIINILSGKIKTAQGLMGNNKTKFQIKEVHSTLLKMGLSPSISLVKKYCERLYEIGYIVKHEDTSPKLYEINEAFSSEYNSEVDWNEIIAECILQVKKQFPEVADEYIKRFCEEVKVIHPFTGEELIVYPIKEKGKKCKKVPEKKKEYNHEEVDELIDDFI